MTANEPPAAELAGDADILELWDAVRWFAYGRAIRCVKAAKGHGGAEIDDLMQCAFMALPKALELWKPEAGSFLTVYGFRLSTAFLDATRQRKPRDRLDPIESALSLDAPLAEGEDGEPFTLADALEDPAASFDAVAEVDYLRRRSEAIRRALDTLDPVQREVVVLRYLKGLTILQTAAQMGITRGKVYLSEKKALRLLRDPSRAPELAEYAERI